MIDDVALQDTGWNAKYALSGIQLPSVYFQGFENYGEVGDEGVGSLRLNYHIIDISLDILPDLVLEAALDGSLISRTRVLELKGHGHVAVGTEGHDERRLDLVFFL